ncbi:MAG: hypothetical protein GY847_01640 [Proteobacteria bacterium]|nr:hypothetical protein [Pseudomonadota bacterium]
MTIKELTAELTKARDHLLGTEAELRGIENPQVVRLQVRAETQRQLVEDILARIDGDRLALIGYTDL